MMRWLSTAARLQGKWVPSENRSPPFSTLALTFLFHTALACWCILPKPRTFFALRFARRRCPRRCPAGRGSRSSIRSQSMARCTYLIHPISSPHPARNSASRTMRWCTYMYSGRAATGTCPQLPPLPGAAPPPLPAPARAGAAVSPEAAARSRRRRIQGHTSLSVLHAPRRPLAPYNGDGTSALCAPPHCMPASRRKATFPPAAVASGACTACAPAPEPAPRSRTPRTT